MAQELIIAISIFVTLIISVPLSCIIAISIKKKDSESIIGKANDKAVKIIDDAILNTENQKREILLKAKEEALKKAQAQPKVVKKVEIKKDQLTIGIPINNNIIIIPKKLINKKEYKPCPITLKKLRNK